MIAAECGGVRVVSLYAPNGRVVGSPFYDAKLAWYDRLPRWLEGASSPDEPLVLGGDFNVAPEDADVWDARACHGGTHVSPPEREAFRRLCRWGLVDAYRRHHPEPGRYTWWDYRAGNFHKNFGMRIDHLLATPARGGPHGVGGDRPRGAQGQADALRPRAARRSTSTRRAIRSTRAGRRPTGGSRRGSRARADGRRGRRELPDPAADRADAREARDRAARGRRLALRAEVGRLPRDRVPRPRPLLHPEPRPAAARPLLPGARRTTCGRACRSAAWWTARS